MNIYKKLAAEQNARNDKISLYYENLVIEDLKNILMENNPVLYNIMMQYSKLPDKDDDTRYSKYVNFIMDYNLNSLISNLEAKYNYNYLRTISKYIKFSLELEEERNNILSNVCTEFEDIKSWIYNSDGSYVIVTKYGTFRYLRLSDSFDMKSVLEDLGLEKAEGNCHGLAIQARHIGCVAATGIERGEWPGQELYHSWMEYDDGQMVMDMTKGLAMPTDDYYKLYLDQDRIINRLTPDELNKADLMIDGNVSYLLYTYINRELEENIKVKK